VSALVRLRRDLFEHMVTDLGRQHPYALERVGFLYGKLARALDLKIVIPVEYVPVPDEQYVDDLDAAATINADAIFDAHQRARCEQQCCLHVHLHPGEGTTWFGTTDLRTLGRIGPSLQRMAKDAAHGGLVLTVSIASTLLWLPGDSEPSRGRVSVVGFPTSVDWRAT
jgi:hypothetical protein